MSLSGPYLTRLTIEFFGKAKVSEFVKFKNFDFFFLPDYQ